MYVQRHPDDIHNMLVCNTHTAASTVIHVCNITVVPKKWAGSLLVSEVPKEFSLQQLEIPENSFNNNTTLINSFS